MVEIARRARRVTVLTGAGMSAESGVPTFREAQTGLWERFDPEQLATPGAWERDRGLVWGWYLWRIATVATVRPHAGHEALARWQARTGVDLRLVTQNVDDLHEQAGASVLAHLHGSIRDFRCDRCGASYGGQIPVVTEPRERVAPPGCERCDGAIRPGVVWFGEGLPAGPLDAATAACATADLVLVVGTSGLVYPAAGLPLVAQQHGVPVIEINPERTPLSRTATHVWRSTAAVALPALVEAAAS